MDDRNRDVYPDKERALSMGVPNEHLKEIYMKTFTTGPFKGRSYEILPSGRLGKRVYPVEE
jgi:hypothetical protein